MPRSALVGRAVAVGDLAGEFPCAEPAKVSVLCAALRITGGPQLTLGADLAEACGAEVVAILRRVDVRQGKSPLSCWLTWPVAGMRLGGVPWRARHLGMERLRRRHSTGSARETRFQPRRLRTRSSPCVQTRQRNPSSFGSNNQSAPCGIGPDFASIGAGSRSTWRPTIPLGRAAGDPPCCAVRGEQVHGSVRLSGKRGVLRGQNHREAD